MKIWACIIIMLFATLGLNAKGTEDRVTVQSNEMRVAEIKQRVHHIKSMHRSEMSKGERAVVNKELKSMKKELRAMHIDKELLAGLIIIIVGLLIFLI